MEKPVIVKENVKPLFETPFVNLYDLQYAPGKHYFDATRRTLDELAAVKTDAEFKQMLPDAVSCIVVVENDGEGPRLLLTREYRYPVGRFLLSVPAGLIEEADREREDAIVRTAVREIQEETGLAVTEGDGIRIVNPVLFSTPGMTDESNALVCVVLRGKDLSALSQDGAVGTECFDGFSLLTEEEAREFLKTGRDGSGNFYSVYTWAALMYFTAGLWK